MSVKVIRKPCLVWLNRMKTIVIGCAAFIGLAVVRNIIRNTRDRVVNLDKLTYVGNLEFLVEFRGSERYFFEQVDICDQAKLKRVFEIYQPDAVMHLAAESQVDSSIDGSADFIETNIIGTYTLLEASRQYWQGLGGASKTTFRFHHISTDEVYGDLESPEALFTEITPYAPSSPYPASKASSDHLVRAWHSTYGLPTLVTNCSKNYGPYHFPEKLIPLMILNALEGKALSVYGKGNQVRAWLYEEDHACALYCVLNEGEVGETYNIGGRNEEQNIEVVHALCELLDELCSDSPYRPHASLITHVQDRPSHDLRFAIDASKIQRDLGWTPEESFRSGMRKTVEWYLNNLEWCRRVQDDSYQRERLGVFLA